MRFSSRVGFDFPASEVQEIAAPTAQGEPARLTVNVLGLAGALGPLPAPFSELLLERVWAKDPAMRDFLDIFNHRLVSMLHRARKRVRPGLPGSCEDLFHRCGHERFWLPLRDDTTLASLLAARRLQRAIGVIYLPHSERMSHYFHTRLPAQFDAMIHIGETRAVQPLVPEPQWHAGEPPETYPSGL